MSNFRFKSENGTETNIEEVVADKFFTYTIYGVMSSTTGTISNDNGSGIHNILGFRANINNITDDITVLKDGSEAGEGITTTNYSYKYVSDDVLQVDSTSALAKYKFYPTVVQQNYHGGFTADYTGNIPSWCTYIKVLLIGGGGGGGGMYGPDLSNFPTINYHCGTGGGCGELVVAGFKTLGATDYNISLGTGGAASSATLNVFDNNGNRGHDGNETKFTLGQTSVTAKGGKGGWTLHQDDNAGLGGGQTDRGDEATSSYDDSSGSGRLIAKNTYAGREGTSTFTVIQDANLERENNEGGETFSRNAQTHYQFWAENNRTSYSAGLVREMKGGENYYGGYGKGGSGSTRNWPASNAPTDGQNGCVCVLFFPGNPKNYPLGTQA